MKIAKLFILFSFLFITNSGFSQVEKIIDSFKIIEQECLDSGSHMPYCSYVYMQQMDSLLNLVYNKLMLKLDLTELKNLKADELNWIKKRDLYFKKVDKEFANNVKSGEWGKDMIMISYQNKSDFIQKRILFLSKKRHSEL